MTMCPGNRHLDFQRLTDAAENFFTFAHFRFLHQSLNDSGASGGRSRVLVHALAGSRAEPFTAPCNGWKDAGHFLAKIPETPGTVRGEGKKLERQFSQPNEGFCLAALRRFCSR